MIKYMSTPSHGYLIVPINVALSIKKKLTSYSYMDHKYAYLEEDCDMPAFLKEFHNIEYIKSVYSDTFSMNGKSSFPGEK